MSNVAISYARFSSATQATGDSLRRQLETTEKYVQAHNLVLDTTLSFRDLGVSAFNKSNVQTGALGLFLQAIQQNKVPAGATLIVESLDRLSRAQVLDALAVFTQILNAGLNIVTLVDNQHYSRQSVGDNFGQLIVSIAIMQRAHEESATKSVRGKASWSQKKKLAKETGLLMTEKVPHWIDVVDRKPVLNQARAQVVQKIIKLAEAGTGNHTIIKTLHAEKIPAWSSSGSWEPSYIQKLLHSPALYGGIDIDGEIKLGYYPPVIDHGRFAQLVATRSARATTKNTNRKGQTVTNLFSGLLKCGYCGSPMNITGYKSRVTGDERKYVGCQGARIGKTTCKMKMWFMDELEKPLLFWLTQVDYGKLMNVGSPTALATEQQQLASLEAQLATATKAIANLMTAIEEGAPGLVARFNAKEAEVATLTKQTEAQRNKVALLSAQHTGTANRMQGMVLMFKALTHTTEELKLRLLREQIQAAINSVVEKIVLFPAGRYATGAKEDRFADVFFKNGSDRRIEPEDW